ncbi:hypothetical protein [Nonomuraea basaltis]|uniref:hypothetical protein n=1 Tax=Nonomuraea basaltis TaxID=2495887 RepID=UPI00110C4A9C|nr:hypothetical protein [Nonomuraea basaltis]TMR90951.1 hypothetical protein EJK15_52610 [Nonomuraea basaltis]
MNKGKWIATTAGMSAALIVGLATPALATPTGCSYQVSSGSASSFCSGGTGEHRIHVLQRHFSPEVGPIAIEGPWAPVGSVSFTKITPHTVVNVWIETRG